MHSLDPGTNPDKTLYRSKDTNNSSNTNNLYIKLFHFIQNIFKLLKDLKRQNNLHVLTEYIVRVHET